MFQQQLSAQKVQIDNGYFITFPDQLTLRAYLSQKFVPFTISSSTENELNYKSNSKLNLGLGASYNSITLNLSYGFKFLNPDKGKGTTKGLDLQFHIFPHKWAIDVLATFIKGYYLDPKDGNGLALNNYYLRPDVHRTIIGFTTFRVPNAHRFSYKAAVTQSEWQTKSAGSFLYGIDGYYGSIKADSALVPKAGNSFYEQSGINKITFINAGPGAGYAYTLVIHKNFFITASAIANLHLNFSSEEKSGTQMNKVNILPGGIYKGAIGYNSRDWSVSANILGNAIFSGSSVSSKKYFIPTGGMRFTVAKRLAKRK